MAFKKSKLAMAFLGLGLMFVAKSAKADTILVHDLSADPATGTYEYTITLDHSANVQSNDGFVVVDFADETSFSFSGDSYFGGFDPFLNFSLTSTLTGGGDLNDGTKVDQHINNDTTDSATIENLVFTYSGTTYKNPASPSISDATATLTIHTSLLGADTGGYAVGVDHSGRDAAFGFSDNSITVPTPAVPAPSSALGGLVLIGLMFAGKVKKALWA